MTTWQQWALAAAAFVVFAPGIAWLAFRFGKRARGSLVLASVLLGMGEVMDPPARRMIEAKEGEKKGPPSPGDPPDV